MDRQYGKRSKLFQAALTDGPVQMYVCVSVCTHFLTSLRCLSLPHEIDVGSLEGVCPESTGLHIFACASLSSLGKPFLQPCTGAGGASCSFQRHTACASVSFQRNQSLLQHVYLASGEPTVSSGQSSQFLARRRGVRHTHSQPSHMNHEARGMMLVFSWAAKLLLGYCVVVPARRQVS